MSPAYPPGAVAPTKRLTRPLVPADDRGPAIYEHGALGLFLFYARAARYDLRQHGQTYVDGYAAAWRHHGTR